MICEKKRFTEDGKLDVCVSSPLLLLLFAMWLLCASAQCVLCSVYFSAQPNKLRPILKFKKYYPIEHIFVPACSSARKIHFFKF